MVTVEAYFGMLSITFTVFISGLMIISTVSEENIFKYVSLNIRVELISNHVISPYFLPQISTGEEYVRYWEHELPEYLEEVDVETTN